MFEWESKSQQKALALKLLKYSIKWDLGIWYFWLPNLIAKQSRLKLRFPYNIIASTSAMLYGIFFDNYIVYTSYWKTHTIIQSLIDWWRSFGRQWRREEGKALRDHQMEDQWQALLFFIDLQLCITYYNILYMYVFLHRSCSSKVLLWSTSGSMINDNVYITIDHLFGTFSLKIEFRIDLVIQN